jgi:hypothetical protein
MDFDMAYHPHPSTYQTAANQAFPSSSMYRLSVFKRFIVGIVDVAVYHALQAGK